MSACYRSIGDKDVPFFIVLLSVELQPSGGSMKANRFGCAVLLLISATLTVHAQVVRGQKYVIRIPETALKLETWNIYNALWAAYGGTIDGPADTITVNGDGNWLNKVFPDDKPFTLQKVRTDRKTGEYELQFEGENRTLKLRFKNEAAATSLAPHVLVPSTRADEVAAYIAAANAAIASKVFSGPLASIPTDRQQALLNAIRSVTRIVPAAEEYKGKHYLVIRLGEGDNVYNSLKVNQTQRVSRRMTEVLSAIKSFHKRAGPCPDGIDGIKAVAQAAYKDFGGQYSPSHDSDEIEAYLPCTLIHQFSEADITSQALVNGSVILVGGDRVEVALNQ
jgi:hypothetical protein